MFEWLKRSCKSSFLLIKKNIFAVFLKNKIMATILLEYDFSNFQAQKTLEYIISLGLFKQAIVNEEETMLAKRKKLDTELKNHLIDLSNFKFNREEANTYE